MVAVERVAGGFAAHRLAGGLVDVAAAAIDGVGRSEGRGVLDGLGIATAGAFEKVRHGGFGKSVTPRFFQRLFLVLKRREYVLLFKNGLAKIFNNSVIVNPTSIVD